MLIPGTGKIIESLYLLKKISKGILAQFTSEILIKNG